MTFTDLDNIEQTEISLFNGVKDNIPKEGFTVEAWLLNTIKPIEEDYKDLVLKYRETFDPEIKEKLPCCTISATFTGRRSLDNIKKKNKLICLDVDRYSKSKIKTSNVCADMLLVKEMFMEHPCTLYVGKSVSGDGIYAVIRIYDEERLFDYFESFRKNLSKIGVNIDASCKDYTRLRFYSYDPDAYFNPDALYYRLPKPKPDIKPIANKHISINDSEKVEKIIEVLEQTSMDITQSYEDWIKIGAALYDAFGDSGESYFHRISSHYSDYSVKNTEIKWKQCKKMNKIKLNSLFYVANSYGVRY